MIPSPWLSFPPLIRLSIELFLKPINTLAQKMVSVTLHLDLWTLAELLAEKEGPNPFKTPKFKESQNLE